MHSQLCIYISVRKKFKGADNLKRRTKFNTDIEVLDKDEAEDTGFIEGDINLGRPIASFNFGGFSSETPPLIKAVEVPKPQAKLFMSSLNGLTPPVDGEHFTVKRSYQLRPSTVRKLNELKTRHPDINVYLNTILDGAIAHYYDYIVNKEGKF
jgi:hypothetical protein